MKRLLCAGSLAFLSACNFTPSYDPELACGPAPDRCPSGLVCSPQNRCVKAATSDGGTDMARLLVTPGTLNAMEGGPVVSFSITLSRAPTSEVTVDLTSSDATSATVSPSQITFTPTDFDQARTGSVTAVDDGDLANEAVTVSATGQGLDAATVNVNVTDDDTLAIETSPAAMLVVTEGMAATIQVRLSHEPTTPITVSVSASGTGAMVSPGGLTFDATNYSVYQDLTVTGLADANTADESATISISGGGLGKVVNVTVTDDDIQNISVTPGTVSIVEGQTLSALTVTLTQQPTTPIVVMVSSSPMNKASVSPSMLTFTSTDYAMPHMVMVTGVDDTDLDPDSATITLSSPPLQARSVTVMVMDNDRQGILANPTSLTLTEGMTPGTIQVSLNFAPTSNTTVTVLSSHPTKLAASTSGPTMSTLLFTPANFSTPQPVTLTVFDDPDTAGLMATVTLSALGIMPDSVANVSIMDDDVQSVQVMPLTLNLTEATGAAHSGAFMVRMAAMPGADVTVTPSAITPSGKVTITPASLVFTSSMYATQQSFTVTAQTDADTSNESLDFDLAATGAFSGSTAVHVNVTDSTLNCNAATCASGCCLNNMCFQQPNFPQCGSTGGAACQLCNVGTETCMGGVCLPI